MTRHDLTFRVFVSSTFGDLIAERNALQDKTFPELRKYCQEQGARFQAIDLRWGVNQEAALDQQTMRICLEELARCQQMSLKPNFILLLGNRYGWRPLPEQVPADEFEAILACVPQPQRTLLVTGAPVPTWRDGATVVRLGWYRNDVNAMPAEYVLQPRAIDFPQEASDDDRRRITKQEAEDWGKCEAAMRVLFETAIKKLGWAVDDPRRRRYRRSATHQEIEHGALHPGLDAEAHVFAYFREITGAPADGSAAGFIDAGRNKDDLDGLRKEIGGDPEHGIPGRLPDNHVYRYEAPWRDGQPQSDLDALCERVRQDLQGIIDAELKAFQQKPALEHEQEAHREFAAERCRHFVGRQDVLERIEGYLVDPKADLPLVVHGVSGCGKTALMAKAVLDLTQAAIGNLQRAIVSRFIGATPGSSDLRTLLGDLCRELGVQEIPQDMNELVRAFRGQLSTEQSGDGQEEAKQPPPDQQRIVLFLDALDQLNPTDNARMLYWMPRELKPNVKLVVSVLASEPKGDAHTRREDPYDLARRIWPESLVEIGPLDETSAAGLLNAWLTEAGRTLQPDQTAEVLDKFARCPLPLYLKLASEEARRWKSWEGVAEPLSDTVEGILEQLLARLERPENHGPTLVSRSLGYLATGKNGLTEDELLDVLSKDKSVVQDFARRSPESPPVDRLPVIVWSRLYADINRYMTHRRADGTVVMDFYHRQVGEAVRKRYLPSEEVLWPAHQQLAEYFAGLDYWAESLEAQRARARRLPPTPRPANVRKVVELPYHRLEVAKLAGKDDPKSPYWDAVADLLTDWQFLEAKAEADPNFQEQESVEPSPATGEAKP